MDQGDCSQQQEGGGGSLLSLLSGQVISDTASSVLWKVRSPSRDMGEVTFQIRGTQGRPRILWPGRSELKDWHWKTLKDAQLSTGFAQISKEEMRKKATKPGSCSKAWFGSGFPVVPGLSGVQVIRLFFSVQEKGLALTPDYFQALMMW